MEHNQDTTSSTDITGDGNIRVLGIPSRVSSMVQPLDGPLFQRVRGLNSSQILTDLTNEHSESDTDDSSSELSSTESLPDLASFHFEPDSLSNDEDSDSLPDLVSNNSDTDSDDSSNSGEENIRILYVDGYNALSNAQILNMDEVRAHPANTNRPTLRIRVRTSAAGNDCNKAEVP